MSKIFTPKGVFKVRPEQGFAKSHPPSLHLQQLGWTPPLQGRLHQLSLHSNVSAHLLRAAERI